MEPMSVELAMFEDLRAPAITKILRARCQTHNILTIIVTKILLNLIKTCTMYNVHCTYIESELNFCVIKTIN